MAYNPLTDYVGLYRLAGGSVSKMEMPGLDFAVSALARAGLITLAVSATAPVVSQSTTAWLQAAVPSYSAEGVMRLWDPVTTAYVAATPALFFKMLETAAGQNGVSWWTAAGGPPANVVGNNGDFAIRTDEPGGIYGPKALGAWPAAPVPGTTDVISSTQLDLTFGTNPGLMLYRGLAAWQALPIESDGRVLSIAGGLPDWNLLTVLFDGLFGDAQGSMLFRDAALWNALGPGLAGQVFSSGGPAANPSWQPRTAEFPSTTEMIFHQTASPLGWTKLTLLNDVGLRVVSGVAGSVAGSAFSTVFAQTLVGVHTLSIGEMPAHTHTESAPGGPQSVQGGGTFPAANIGASSTSTGSTGGGNSHNHTINLTLAYTDVIIARKD
jgi:hypothetical protein